MRCMVMFRGRCVYLFIVLGGMRSRGLGKKGEGMEKQMGAGMRGLALEGRDRDAGGLGREGHHI